MANYVDDDLISFASLDDSPQQAPSPHPRPNQVTMRSSRAQPEGVDGFAGLTDLLRSRSFTPRLAPTPVHNGRPAGAGLTSFRSTATNDHPNNTRTASTVKDAAVLGQALSPNDYLRDYESKCAPRPSKTGLLALDQANRMRETQAPQSSQGSVCSTDDKPYSEESMQKLERLRMAFDLVDSDANRDDVSPSPVDPSPGHFIFPTQPVSEGSPIPPLFSSAGNVAVLPPSSMEETGSIVRLTKPAYDALNAAINTLEQEKARLIKRLDASKCEEGDKAQSVKEIDATTKKLDALQRGTTQSTKERLDDTESDALRKLRAQIDMAQSQNASLNAALGQKDDELRKKTSELNALTKKHDPRLKGMADVVAQRDAEIAGLKMNVVTLKKLIEDLTFERDALLQKSDSTTAYAGRVKELTDAMLQREKFTNGLQEKIEAERTKNETLTEQLKAISNAAPSQKKLDDLQKKLADQTADTSRLRNELRDANMRYEISQATIARLSNDGKSLRGSAHLITPNPHTKLPSTVFDCIQCYAKNLQCDTSVKCRNCIDSDSECSRWRCSLVHVLRNCSFNRPCGMTHGQDGWLKTNEARPQW